MWNTPIHKNLMAFKLLNEGINFRKIDDNKIGITLDERTRPDTIESVWKAFGLEKRDSDFAESNSFKFQF